jgi:hypothetical protein
VIPACPRCGYDLSGAVATWTDSCPLCGICSECGLEFAWVDVHDPDRNRVRGLFEHARELRQSARWLELTWFMTFWPPLFWRRVRLESPVNARRAAAWPLLITASVWAAGSVVMNAVTLASNFMMPAPLRTSSDELLGVLVNGWMCPVGGFDNGLSGGFDWSNDLRGWIRYMLPLLAASGFWVLLILLLPWTMRKARVRRAHVLRAAAYSFAWVPMLALIHLGDSFSWIARLLGGSGSRGDGDYFSDHMYGWWPYLLLALTVWILIWWHSALRIGFRLEGAGRVWSALAVAVLLASLLALIATGGLVYLLAGLV